MCFCVYINIGCFLLLMIFFRSPYFRGRYLSFFAHLTIRQSAFLVSFFYTPTFKLFSTHQLKLICSYSNDTCCLLFTFSEFVFIYTIVFCLCCLIHSLRFHGNRSNAVTLDFFWKELDWTVSIAIVRNVCDFCHLNDRHFLPVQDIVLFILHRPAARVFYCLLLRFCSILNFIYIHGICQFQELLHLFSPSEEKNVFCRKQI